MWLLIVCLPFSRESERNKEIAMLEAQVYRLSEILGEQRAATRENVQRKQARTGGGNYLFYTARTRVLNLTCWISALQNHFTGSRLHRNQHQEVGL